MSRRVSNGLASFGRTSFLRIRGGTATWIRGLTVVLCGAVISGCGDLSPTDKPARTKAKLPARAPLVAITGSVRNAAGPVRDATVFLLEKKRLGGDRSGLPHVVTNADGRFRIRTRRATNDRWLGVVHEHHMHSHMDLAGWDGAAPVSFELKPAHRVVITVVDEQKMPLGNQVVMLTPWPPADQFQLPGPGHRQGERTALTDSRGRATHWIGSPGPVTVRAELDGRFPVPAVLAIEAEETVGLVRGHRGVAFPARLQGTANSPLRGSVEIEWYQDGDLVRTRDVPLDDTGRPVGRFAPGTFDLRLRPTNGETAWMLGVHFDADAQDKALTITERPMGALTLTGGPIRQMWVRRNARLWQVIGGSTEANATHALEAGSYDAYLLHPSGERCAVVSNQRVPKDATSEASIPWEAGTWMNFDGASFPPGTRRVRVMHKTLGRLPLIGRTGTRVRTGIELFHLHLAREGADVQLGPYPAGAITIQGLR